MTITQFIDQYETENPAGFTENECSEMLGFFPNVDEKEFKNFLSLYPKHPESGIWLRGYVNLAIKSCLTQLDKLKN